MTDDVLFREPPGVWRASNLLVTHWSHPPGRWRAVLVEPGGPKVVATMSTSAAVTPAKRLREEAGSAKKRGTAGQEVWASPGACFACEREILTDDHTRDPRTITAGIMAAGTASPPLAVWSTRAPTAPGTGPRGWRPRRWFLSHAYLPYGRWDCADGRSVLFNRWYKPI